MRGGVSYATTNDSYGDNLVIFVTLAQSDVKEIDCKGVWLVYILPLQLTKANRTTIDLQNRQNLSSPSRIFASILQVRQAASQINPAIRPVLPSRR